MPVDGVPFAMRQLNQAEVHYYATLWRIERTDDVVLRFTDHDTILEYGGEDYLPAAGFSPTAREKQAGVKDHNLEIVGVLSSDAITEVDLRAGRYREAKVVEMLVDWRFPYSGYFAKNVYWVAQITFSGESWQVQLSGQPIWLNKEVGWLFSFDCRFTLGNAFGLDGVAGCKYDIESQRLTRTVGIITDPLRAFGPTVLLPTTGLQWEYGEVTWTSGDNIGLKAQVQHHDTVGGAIDFELNMPYEIQVGDTFTITPGCDRKKTTCVMYGQLDNFGGFPFMPGTDRMIGGPIG